MQCRDYEKVVNLLIPSFFDFNTFLPNKIKEHWTDPNGTDFRRFIVYDLMPRSTDLSGFHGFEFNEGGA